MSLFRISIKQSDKLDFRPANYIILGYIIFLLGIIQMPNAIRLQILGGWAAGLPVLIGLYKRAVERFDPKSAIDAKRANEQVKALVQFWSSMSVAAVAVFVFSKVSQSSFDEATLALMVVGIALGFWSHSAARSLLALLKDETEGAYLRQ